MDLTAPRRDLLTAIETGLSVALDALDPSRLTLTRSGAAEGSA